MEFNGTKGKWTKQQDREGDIIISALGFRNLATINFYPEGFREKYINGKLSGSPAPDSLNFRRECIYNAKLIVKAPELLDHLQNLIQDMGELISELEDRGFEWQQAGYYTSSKELIKEITEP